MASYYSSGDSASESHDSGAAARPAAAKAPTSNMVVGKVEVIGTTNMHPTNMGSGAFPRKPEAMGNAAAGQGWGQPAGMGGIQTGQSGTTGARGLANVASDFYQAAVMNAGIPVVGLDPAGCVLAWNPAAVRLFGRGEGEVMGRPLETLIPSEYRPVAAKAFQRTIQQRSVNFYEMSLVPQGGKNATHVGVTLSCVIDSAGALKGVMAWMRDISNRKELEAHLTRTRHMASVGTLAAGVAHHFNNIACGMGTMVDFALATEDPAAMLKALRMSAEACSRISYITQSMLACSGDAAGGECAAAPDLSDLTEEIYRFADAVEPTLQHKGIALELDLQARRITAVPRMRFGQALQHLLRNAEDAIAERAAMIGAPPVEMKITIRTQSQGDQVMLQIADTGVGIDPDDMPQIFDPFFTKKGVQGGGNKNNPGLGLTLVHAVVMDMGGHIWADSAPHHGTTIHILIPVVV